MGLLAVAAVEYKPSLIVIDLSSLQYLEKSFLPAIYQNKSGFCKSASFAYCLHALQLHVPLCVDAFALQLPGEQLYPLILTLWLVS